MKSLTIRNIPDELMIQLKLLAALEDRSLNGEILHLLKSVMSQLPPSGSIHRPVLPRELQLEIWRELCGSWEDDRGTEEILEEIYAGRTVGRDVEW